MQIAEGIYYDLPESVYRPDPAVSQSLLKEFGDEPTPLHFATRKKRVATPDMEFGTTVHSAVLTPKLFPESYYLRPDEYPSDRLINSKPVMKSWHGASDWCKDWLAKHADRPVMTQEDLDKIPKIVESLKQLPEFSEALAKGKKEVAYFKRDEETGLMLKCKCDLVCDDANGNTVIFDLKKRQRGMACEKEFRPSCVDYGYDIQAASYLHITGAKYFVFVPFEDEEPFDCCQWLPDAEFIRIGYEKWRSLLLRYAECYKSGVWPGYQKTIAQLKLPEWATK